MSKSIILDVIFKNIKKKENEYSDEDRAILNDITQAVREMEEARSLFNSVCDPKLIELAIHEEDIARIRYDYLLGMAKKRDLRRIK